MQAFVDKVSEQELRVPVKVMGGTEKQSGENFFLMR